LVTLPVGSCFIFPLSLKELRNPSRVMCLFRSAHPKTERSRNRPRYTTRLLGSPPARLMKAERESFGLILSLGLNLSGSPWYFHITIDHPVFLFRASRYSSARRLRSKGALKQTMTVPAAIASQNSLSTNSLRDLTPISSGQPSSTSARSLFAYS